MFSGIATINYDGGENWKLLPFLVTFANFNVFVPFTVSIITKPPTMTEKYKLPDKYVEKIICKAFPCSDIV